MGYEQFSNPKGGYGTGNTRKGGYNELNKDADPESDTKMDDAQNGEGSGEKKRSLRENEITIFLQQGGDLQKILLLSSLANESKKTTIVATGIDIAKAAESNKVLKKGVINRFKEVDTAIILNGKISISLKSGKSKLELDVFELLTIKINQGATIDASNLKVEDKIMKDYKFDPVVKNISGHTSLSGISVIAGKILDITPINASYKSDVVENEGSYDTFNTLVDIKIKEKLLPDLSDRFLGLQGLGEKDKK